MGWAKDSFERELARSYIFPVNQSSGSSYNYSPSPTPSKPKKKYRKYYQYDFPTEAQVEHLTLLQHTLV